MKKIVGHYLPQTTEHLLRTEEVAININYYI